jgi:hypothetical protein
LSPGLRFLIHVSRSSWVWVTLSLTLRVTLTGLEMFLVSAAFSLAPVPSLWLSMAFTSHCPDCWSAHI